MQQSPEEEAERLLERSELVGQRQRYRLLDIPMLMEYLGAGAEESFRENYAYCLDEAIEREELKRDAKCTESLTVGSESYVKKVGLGIRSWIKIEVVEDEEDQSTRVIRESVEPNSYS